MAVTPSTMQALGMPAPYFSLPDVVTGKTIRIDDFRQRKALVVMFLCQHCPYVKHIEHEIAKMARDYQRGDTAFIAISSNDADHYPDDAPAKLAEMAERLGFYFPFCYDETQEIAKLYGAACTPDFFLHDSAQRLVYRGQFDPSRPGNAEPVTGRDLRSALEAVLSGETPAAEQRPSIGCNIKWKPGKEPLYFRK